MTTKPTYEQLEARIRELEGARPIPSLPESVRPSPYPSLVDTIPCALYGYVRWPDGRNRFVYMSAQCEGIFGYDFETILATPTLLWDMVHPDDVERLRREDAEANRLGRLFHAEVRIILASGAERWIQLSSMPSPQRVDGQALWTGVVLDITERKAMEEEKDRLLQELRAALAKISTLEAILPICSFCKKIQDDHGEWQPVEVYIRDHTQADFSHGLCPDCLRTHYPDI